MKGLQEEIQVYWTGRAEGYSQVNKDELACTQKEKWLGAIKSRIGYREKGVCRILDVGAGPGFFSIILAEDGFPVTAVDFTEAMLEKARENAGSTADRIEFLGMDAQNLTFPDNTFNAVITRNLTWNLPNPAKAYGEWMRVLKKGGVLLNFDANWYGYIDDAEKRKAYERDRARTAESNVEDLYEGTDIEKMEAIAQRLPLSCTNRPAWDQKVLRGLGAERVEAEEDIWKEVWSYEECINQQATPMFLVKAVK